MSRIAGRFGRVRPAVRLAPAIAVALLVLLVPRLEAVAARLAVISYCVPLLAIGPIILVVFGGFRHDELWAGIVVVTAVSIVGVVESLVLTRFGRLAADDH
ncbi:hypothetical protein [Streptosporangium sp. KLBMP 9127]